MDYAALDEEYLAWLYARIGSTTETRKTRTYWSLCRQLYHKEFVWLIANDDNRVEDGRYLRYQFLEEARLHHVDVNWMGQSCSTLELLIGLANRLAFLTDRDVAHWFWEMLNNLNLSGYNDRNYHEQEIEDIVDTLMWRNYRRDGQGGLFPMQNPAEDQRKVELWYQMNSYIQDRHH